MLRRLGHIWREIKMAGDPGRPVAESVKAFRRSISISEKVGQGFEAILAVLDLAEVLISADRLAEAAAAARGMSPLIEKLGEGSQIYSQWLDFLALLLQGAQKASQLQVILLREALHAEASDVRPRLSR